MQKKGIKKSRSFSTLLARDPRLRVRFDENLGVIKSLRGNLAKVSAKGSRGLRSAGVRFLKENADLLGKVRADDLKVLNEAKDAYGGVSVTLQH